MSNYTLPTEFEVNGELFRIRNNGDYRTVLSCFNILYDNELSEKERLWGCLIIFYENFNDTDDLFEYSDYLKELTNKMIWFFDCGNSYETKKTNTKRLIDWDKDETLIVSAINKVAGKEIRLEPYMHYWTFISYYMAIGDCSLSTIVAIREKIANGTKLEKHEQKFRKENPHYFTIDMRTQQERDEDEWLQSLWNGGSN